MAALFGFGSNDKPAPAVAPPTPVAPPPDRSSDETAQLSARQRARFSGAGSFTKNFFTGDSGTSGVSTTTRLLGGGQ